MYVCTQCEYEHRLKLGKCPSCNTFGTMIAKIRGGESSDTSKGTVLFPMDASVISDSPKVWSLLHPEFARFFGKGICVGGVYLLGGRPGVGKSTAMMHILHDIIQQGGSVGYFSGEEHPSAIHDRYQRMYHGKTTADIYHTTNVGDIIQTQENKKYTMIIVDSIQTIRDPEGTHSAGSPQQIRTCAHRLCNLAKTTNTILRIIGHITKDGLIAGPKYLEHMVDVVRTIDGEEGDEWRIARMSKNRFGSDQQLGLFRMTATGLESASIEMKSIAQQTPSSPGIAYSIGMDDGRAIPICIESLLVKSYGKYPTRHVVGMDKQRVEMLCAIAEKYCGLTLGQYDIYLNIPGRISYRDSGIDLAVIATLASAIWQKDLGPRVRVGEVGLRGYVTQASAIDKRAAIGAKNFCIHTQIPHITGLKEYIQKI